MQPVKEVYLKSQTRSTISLKLDKFIHLPLSSLLQKGFLVEIPKGSTIKSLFCEHFNVEENYLEDRIQTIFLDGKPVDDVDLIAHYADNYGRHLDKWLFRERFTRNKTIVT